MSTRTFKHKKLMFLLPLLLALPAISATTAISDFPLDTKLNAVNAQLTIDDSGSMNIEILLTEKIKDGVHWVGTHRVSYLFPEKDESKNDGTYNASDYYSVKFDDTGAYYRSPEYNLTYYNPKIDYAPWQPAIINGYTYTFANADITAARYHPYFTNSKYGPCTSTDSTTTNAPSTKQDGTKTTCYTMDFTQSITGDFDSIVNSSYTDVVTTSSNKSATFNPAVFYLVDPSCSTGCVTAPDGKKLRKFDILSFSGTSYQLPDGTTITRDKNEELQNFANWFTYYRNRQLMLSGSMGKVLTNLQNSYTNLLISVPTFSEAYNKLKGNIWSTSFLSTVYDLKKEDSTLLNAKVAIGKFYTLNPSGSTYTLNGLKYGGAHFNETNKKTNGFGTDESYFRCSSNNIFILTDGYATDTSGSDTLYKYAKDYYDKGWNDWKRFNDPTAGQYDARGYTTKTYGISLGSKGNLFDGITKASDSTNWPTTAPADADPSNIDDLWHATVYSEAKMLLATDPNNLETNINLIIRAMFTTSSHSNVPVSQKYLSGNDTAIVTTFNTGEWTSDIKSHPVYNDINNPTQIGSLNTSITNWSARELLDKRDPTTRRIVTYRPSSKSGIPFNKNDMSTNEVKLFNTSTSTKDGADVIDFLRGDRTKEGTNYNSRGGVLGDIVNSSPVFVTGAVTAYPELSYQQFAFQKSTRQKMVYVGANDGMLHAFNADTGVEEWAYVPQMLHSVMNADYNYVRRNYQHKFYVDGHLATWDVKFSSDNTWRTLLVGGLRSGGKGYFALDVTTPPTATETEADIAKRVKWEFTDTNMGLSFGKPVIVNTEKHGWVVLLSSGYNNADGKAHIFVVNAETGVLIKDLNSADFGFTDGSATDPLGIAQIGYVTKAAPDPDTTGYIRYAYVGDMKGNVWKFDLSAKEESAWKVSKFAEKVSLDNTGRPITSAPAVGFVNTAGHPNPNSADPNGGQLAVDTKAKRLMVYVGTGKLLNSTDFTDSTLRSQNGFFAMEDFMATTTEPNDTVEQAFVYGKGTCANFGCLKQVGLGQDTASQGMNNWGADQETALTKWWISGQYDQTAFCSAGESCSGSSFKDSSNRQRSKRGWYLGFSETGNESVIQDPIFAYGFVTFVTSMVTNSRHGTLGTCENAYSAQYVLGGTKGGELPTTDFIDGQQWSRKNVDFGIASFQTLVVGADGWVRSIVNTGGKTSTTILPAKDTPNCAISNSCPSPDCTVTNTCPAPPASTNTLRRWGWKEVFR